MYFDKNNKIIKRNFQESNPLEIIRVSNQLVDDFLYTNGKIIMRIKTFIKLELWLKSL